MSTAAAIVPAPGTASRVPVVYPSSDGKPMAENTTQYEWIVRLKGGIEACCPTAFVAGDLLWYFVEGDPKQCVAPDVLVAFGRPRGPRMTYLQWEEGVIPQVVVQVWSPGNRWPDRARKLLLYSRLGVEEFITYDPDSNDFAVFLRSPNGVLLEVESAANHDWVSPLLGIRFAPGEEILEVYGPDGARLPFFGELVEGARLAKEGQAKAEQACGRAEEERATATARAEALAAKLRALGIEPE